MAQMGADWENPLPSFAGNELSTAVLLMNPDIRARITPRSICAHLRNLWFHQKIGCVRKPSQSATILAYSSADVTDKSNQEYRREIRKRKQPLGWEIIFVRVRAMIVLFVQRFAV